MYFNYKYNKYFLRFISVFLRFFELDLFYIIMNLYIIVEFWNRFIFIEEIMLF